jgi:hypothetical protein
MMSNAETIAKFNAIFKQCPDLRTSKTIVHMPVPHPDRNEKNKTLQLNGVTWAELYELLSVPLVQHILEEENNE